MKNKIEYAISYGFAAIIAASAAALVIDYMRFLICIL
jgi:hypothetical protein